MVSSLCVCVCVFKALTLLSGLKELCLAHLLMLKYCFNDALVSVMGWEDERWTSNSLWGM